MYVQFEKMAIRMIFNVPCVTFMQEICLVAVYVVEAMMKICGFGPSKYFSSGWNM